ncbi:MAG: flagellar hook-basal body complex protein FliE [Hyphomicrobiales bacterium]|nr:flagellar hook-basal body complex protein FliE [Hyphomicrobiales bacterium]
MNSSSLAAAKAYLSAQQMNAGGAGLSGTAGAQSDGGFGEALADAMQNALETGRQTEMQAQSLARGDGEMVNVVTAVAETEMAMQTLVTVRDRVISAYQEIMNMPI